MLEDNKGLYERYHAEVEADIGSERDEQNPLERICDGASVGKAT